MGRDESGRPPASTPFKDYERRGVHIPAGSIRGGMLAAEFSTIIKTVDYTAADILVILVNASSSAVTITLPLASTSKNKVYYIKKTDSTANSVTVEADGTDTIDDELNIVLSLQYQYVMVACDGAEWWTLGGEYVKMEEILRAILAAINEINQTAKETQKEVKDINS